jgi:hypothetical protein
MILNKAAGYVKMQCPSITGEEEANLPGTARQQLVHPNLAAHILSFFDPTKQPPSPPSCAVHLKQGTVAINKDGWFLGIRPADFGNFSATL